MNEHGIPQYDLYIMPTCPFCKRVLAFMDENNIELPIHDITVNPADREELLRVGGKVQVPCLFIDGTALYESADIIAHLQEAFA